MPWMRLHTKDDGLMGWGHWWRTVSCLNEGKCMVATRRCLFCWCLFLVICLLFHSKDNVFIVTFSWSFLSGTTYDVSFLCRLLIVFWWYLSIDFVYVRVLVSFCFWNSTHFILLDSDHEWSWCLSFTWSWTWFDMSHISSNNLVDIQDSFLKPPTCNHPTIGWVWNSKNSQLTHGLKKKSDLRKFAGLIRAVSLQAVVPAISEDEWNVIKAVIMFLFWGTDRTVPLW